ncbi:hypothetical protein MK852_06630 [Shewanella benthica]|uniref:hypothetical protein n=1 Tax=Shewanella benthica TaxID=43661 RepID=UPI00187A3A5F|nr:hypothetical protein [Shewanella benthica]MBE7213907.1 hypothetical protein [Shewanella benthica]MCL1061813.1 hypothetical protein [Shewanella benthica]
MNHFKHILVAIPFIFLSACSSAPPQVEASISLIGPTTSKISGQVIPESLWVNMQMTPTGVSQIYQDYQLQYGDKYISALNQDCRKMLISKEFGAAKAQRRTVCEAADQSWVLLPLMVDSKEKAFELSQPD